MKVGAFDSVLFRYRSLPSHDIDLLIYEYLCAESARLVLPWHLRGRTGQLITCGTVQLFFDFLLHLIYLCYKYIVRAQQKIHFFFRPQMTTFLCTQVAVRNSENTGKRPVSRRRAWRRVFFFFFLGSLSPINRKNLFRLSRAVFFADSKNSTDLDRSRNSTGVIFFFLIL